jgi:hypothetical protein
MLYHVEVEKKTLIFKTLTDLFAHMEENNLDIGITKHMFYKTYDKYKNENPNEGKVIFENSLIKVTGYDIGRDFPPKKTKKITALFLFLLSLLPLR